jgi:DNA-binding transcriptional regulator YiaG
MDLRDPWPWPELQKAIRPLTSDEDRRLRASLEEHGQVQTIILWRDGRIIDGANRWRILGERCQFAILNDITEEQAFALGLTLNAARRQLTGPQLKKIADLYGDAIKAMRANGMTQKQVAATLGVSQGAVSKASRTIPRNTATTAKPDNRRKVAADQEERIREKFAAGKKQTEIAAEEGVAQKTVSRIAAKPQAPPSPEPRRPSKPKPSQAAVRIECDTATPKAIALAVRDELLRLGDGDPKHWTAFVREINKMETAR